MFSFLLTKTKKVSIIAFIITNYRMEVFDLYALDKRQLEYLSRTIMPELYERQAMKDAFMEYIADNYEGSYVKDGNGSVYQTGDSAAVEERR